MARKRTQARAAARDARRRESAPRGSATAARPGTALVAAGLALAIAAIYAPVLGHEFVLLDDPAYFLVNPNLDGRFGPDDVWNAFAAPYFANWIPLTSISIAIDDALFGTAPAGHLAVNALLHFGASLLLFLAFARMTGDRWSSGFVAAVFAVHPLHVESVAWASQRKDVLFGVFWMATLVAYARYAERESPGRYAAVLAGTVAALLSKPAAVTLPMALLLLDFWPLRRLDPDPRRWFGDGGQGLRRIAEKAPLFLAVAIVSGVTLAVQGAAGAERSDQVALSLRILNAAASSVAYLGDSLWPAGLAAFYPYVTEDLTGVRGAGSVFLLVGVSVVLTLGASRHPHVLVGWLWFLGTLVPTIGLVQVGSQARADRYMYVPLVGLAIAVAWSARSRFGASPALGAAAAAVLVVFGVVAHLQVGYWRGSVTLFERAVAVTEDNATAHALLGNAYRERGDAGAAARNLQESLRLKPERADTRLALAMVWLDVGRLAEAEAELERATLRGRESADAQLGLGLVAERRGELARAIGHYREALAVDGDHLEAANNLAWLLATQPSVPRSDAEEAVALAQRVTARKRDDAATLDTLAAAEAAAGRPADAARTQERALAVLTAQERGAWEREFRARLEQYRARAAGR